MAETAERNSDEFKGKNCVFVADWLKTKGLHNILNCFTIMDVACYDL